jgi:hypothetical protein
MSERVECPSGLVGSIRGLLGKEIKVLTDRGLIKKGEITDALLDACWESTEDPGPYRAAIRASGTPDWQKVLQGDRFFLATRIHAATYGAFEFTTNCRNEDCENHKRGFMVTIDIVKELKVQLLSAEDRDAFTGGRPFVEQLPDGRNFSFRLRTGADETRFVKMGITDADAGKLFIPVMCSRILAIDGVDDAKKRQFFEEAPLPYSWAALELMDRHDCGVETAFENECPKCFVPVEFEIPFRKCLLAAPKKARHLSLVSSSDDDLAI